MADMMFDHSPTPSVAQTSSPNSFELAPRRLTSDSSQQPNELGGGRPEPAPRLRSKSVRSCVTPPRFLSSNAAATPSAPAHTVLLHLAPGTSVRVPYRVPTIPPYMAGQLIHGMLSNAHSSHTSAIPMNLNALCAAAPSRISLV